MDHDSHLDEILWESFIFEVRIFIKIKIYSVTWFNIIKFCHFSAGQIMQCLFILLQAVHVLVDGWQMLSPELGILAASSDLPWRTWLTEFVYVRFPSLLAAHLLSLFLKLVSCSASSWAWLPLVLFLSSSGLCQGLAPRLPFRRGQRRVFGGHSGRKVWTQGPPCSSGRSS